MEDVALEVFYRVWLQYHIVMTCKRLVEVIDYVGGLSVLHFGQLLVFVYRIPLQEAFWSSREEGGVGCNGVAIDDVYSGGRRNSRHSACLSRPRRRAGVPRVGKFRVRGFSSTEEKRLMGGMLVVSCKCGFKDDEVEGFFQSVKHGDEVMKYDGSAGGGVCDRICKDIINRGISLL